MPEARVVQAVLRRVARRLWVWRALRRFLCVTAGAAAISCAVLLVFRFGLGHDARGWGLLAAATIGIGIAVLPGLRRVPTAQAARAVDAAFDLGERFVTAVECLERPDGMSALVVRDAARWSFRLDIRRVPRPPVGWAAGWAALGMAAVTLAWALAGPGPLSAAYLRISDARGAAPLSGAAAPRASGRESARAGDKPTEAAGELRRTLGLEPGSPATSTAQAASAPPVNRSPASGPGGGQGAGTGAGQTVAGLDGSRRDAAGPDRADEKNPHRAESSTASSPGAPSHSARSPMPASGMIPGTGLPTRAGSATGPGSRGGAMNVAAESNPGAGSTLGAGPMTDPAVAPGIGKAGGASPDQRHAVPGGVSADAVFARAPVPPALRQYILRYFEQLRASPSGEEPS